MKYFIFLTFFIMGCSSSKVDKQLKRRNLDEYFTGSGVVRYFLSDLPTWANFSQTASCQRSVPARYFNLEFLFNSYGYKYEEAVQLQYMFNVEMVKLKKRTGADFLPFSDEEKLFFTLTDKIQANIRTFRAPSFKRVNIVWIDPYLNTKKGLNKIKGLLKSAAMDEGHPVLVSMCLSHMELEDFLKSEGIQSRNIRYMPHEMLSPYTADGKKEPLFQLNIGKLFKENQKLYFYMPKGNSKPKEFIGNFLTKYY